MGFAWELPVPLLTAAFIGVYVAATRDLPPESRVFPHTIMTGLVLLGVAILLIEARGGRRSEAEAIIERKSMAPMVFALSLGFVAIFALFGFLAASVIFLLTTMILLREPPIAAAAIAIGVSTGLYLLFAVFLHVPL